MTFLDTNVLVYAVDSRHPAKHAAARSILVDALGGDRAVISIQVLNEFANVAMKKLQMTEDEVRAYIGVFRRIRVLAPSVESALDALSIKKRHGIHFYDALMLAAAESVGCSEILTEDLNDGQLYGPVKAVNPFKGL